mmetsp:Transcript_84788/g.162243  ORF Transcript_84788/g.162243 Transcript_84788/m.162243 type:complete len:85 (-) Transcript_84788:646-900(-)
MVSFTDLSGEVRHKGATSRSYFMESLIMKVTDADVHLSTTPGSEWTPCLANGTPSRCKPRLDLIPKLPDHQWSCKALSTEPHPD